jgi:hypothetical protein
MSDKCTSLFMLPHMERVVVLAYPAPRESKYDKVVMVIWSKYGHDCFFPLPGKEFPEMAHSLKNKDIAI